MTAKPIRKCPECGQKKLKRLLGAGAGIIFKGAGFYQTDYRSDSYKKTESSEKAPPENTAAKKTPESGTKKPEGKKKA